MTALLSALDPTAIITTLGYVGVFCIIGAESGLLFGFFLPGDSLLFTAGILAATGSLNLGVLLVLIPVAAVLGDQLGYWIGSLVGPRLFVREDSFFFNKKHVERSRAFYAKYGPRAVVIARFVPIVRTFIPLLAGVGSMRYRTFLAYNVLGGLLWGLGVTLAGYFLGRSIPNIDQYLLPLIGVVVLVSLAPIAIEFWRERRKNPAA